jgi:predicted component of type VI protein secretion system
MQLVVRTGPTAGKIYSLEKNELTIGRDMANDIVISDSEVSRRHARIFLQGTNYVLEDLGSTNGTFVNRQRLMGPYVLRPGEVVTLGEHINVEVEAVMADPDATVASPVAPRPPVSAPPPVVVNIPPPQPAQQMPPPQPMPRYQPPVSTPPVQVYTPPTPAPLFEEPYTPERRLPTWAIALIIAILLLVCVCGVILYVIDARNLWCDLFPFLFPACQ